MDLTPFLGSLEGTTLDQVLLLVAISGRVAIAMKGRFLLRSVCESFQGRTKIRRTVCWQRLEILHNCLPGHYRDPDYLCTLLQREEQAT